jgi:hypothetical protein
MVTCGEPWPAFGDAPSAGDLAPLRGLPPGLPAPTAARGGNSALGLRLAAAVRNSPALLAPVKVPVVCSLTVPPGLLIAGSLLLLVRGLPPVRGERGLPLVARSVALLLPEVVSSSAGSAAVAPSSSADSTARSSAWPPCSSILYSLQAAAARGCDSSLSVHHSPA